MEPNSKSTTVFCVKEAKCEVQNSGPVPNNDAKEVYIAKQAPRSAASSSRAEVPQSSEPEMGLKCSRLGENSSMDGQEKIRIWKCVTSRFTAPSPSLLSFLISILSISFWALGGNACRISLSTAFIHRFFFYPGFSYFGPNAFGSMAMGFFQSSLFLSENELPWLIRGLCVGYCGSFTTLSSWMIDVANASSFVAAAEELICGLTIPFVFYIWGLDLGKGLHGCVVFIRKKRKVKGKCASDAHLPIPLESVPPTGRVLPSSSTARCYWWIDLIIFVVITIAGITVPAVLYSVQHYYRPPGSLLGSMSRADLRTTVLAPVGAIPRFLLSYALNKQPLWRSFPVGTFCSNVLAVLLAMLLYRAEYQNTSQQSGDAESAGATTLHEENACVSWACAAILTGVCGALSTVSSFVSEVMSFHREGRVGMAYFYVFVTIAVTLIIAGVGRQDNFR